MLKTEGLCNYLTSCLPLTNTFLGVFFSWIRERNIPSGVLFWGCGSLHRSIAYSLVTIKWIKTCRHTVYITVPSRFLHNHHHVCVCFAVKSKRTRSPAALQRVWPSRSASVSSLRGRRFPTRSKHRANSWSWRTSSTPSSRPEPFTSPAPPQQWRRRFYVRVLLGGKKKRVKRAGAHFPNTDRLLLFVLFSLIFNFFYFNH